MENQRSQLSKGIKLPKELRKAYILKRIKLGDIEISEKERQAIHECMAKGSTFLLLGEYTIMINSISAIEPKYGERNIPPSPGSESPHYGLWLETYHPQRVFTQEQKDKMKLLIAEQQKGGENHG